MESVTLTVEWFLRSVPWLSFTLGSSALFFFLETYLDLRQIRQLLLCEVPPILQKWIIIDKFRMKKIHSWSIMRLMYSRMEATLEFIAECVVLSYQILVWFWGISLDILLLCNLGPDYKVTRGLLFILLVSFCSSMCRVPFHLFRILYVDTHFDIRHVRSILTTWFWDQSKMFILSVAFGVPLLMTTLALLNWEFSYYWLYACVFVSAASIFFTDIYQFIAPFFSVYKPLPDGPLKEEIKNLAKKLDFPLSEVLILEDNSANPQNAHSNAFLMGFRFSKNIVLYDLLVKQLTRKEILAILGHEIGHHKRYHTYKSLFIQLVTLGVFIFHFSRVVNMPEFYRCFGFEEVDVSVGLLLFSYIYSAFANLPHWLTNAISRQFEYSADIYAIANGCSKLESALIKVHANNISNLMPDPWYAHYHCSHPSLAERLEQIGKFKKRLKKERALMKNEGQKDEAKEEQVEQEAEGEEEEEETSVSGRTSDSEDESSDSDSLTAGEDSKKRK